MLNRFGFDEEEREKDFQHYNARHNGKMRDYYRIYEALGQGTYGKVHKCQFISGQDSEGYDEIEERAVKVLSKAHMESKDIISFYNEVSSLFELQQIGEELINKQFSNIDDQITVLKVGHQSIMKIFHYFEDQNRFLLVFEFCQGEELFARAQEQKNFKESDVALIVYQILCAVYAMHSRKIIHRDLKPENILFFEKDSYKIKIIDFGTAVKQKNDELFTGKIGTVMFMAPEIIAPELLDENFDKDKNPYDFSADLWSVGVITYFLFLHKYPFEGKNQEEIKISLATYIGNTETLKKDEFQSKMLSEEAQDFIMTLLQPKPEDRGNALTAIGHKWFKNHEREIQEFVIKGEHAVKISKDDKGQDEQ